MTPDLDEMQRFVLDQLRAIGRPQAVEALAWHWHNRKPAPVEKPVPASVLARVLRAVRTLTARGQVQSAQVDVLTSRRAGRAAHQQLICWIDGRAIPPSNTA